MNQIAIGFKVCLDSIYIANTKAFASELNFMNYYRYADFFIPLIENQAVNLEY